MVPAESHKLNNADSSAAPAPNFMATVKKGILIGPPEWWKHLRENKRFFWKKHRGAEKRDIKGRLNESV